MLSGQGLVKSTGRPFGRPLLDNRMRKPSIVSVLTFPISGSLSSVMAVSGFEPLNLSIPETINNVVVHHADRLHMCIDHRRAHKCETPAFKIFAERVRF